MILQINRLSVMGIFYALGSNACDEFIFISSAYLLQCVKVRCLHLVYSAHVYVSGMVIK